MRACDCPVCASPADAEMPHAETAHEPVELPDRPRPFRVHFPDGRTQDVTLHPDGVMTTVLAGQVLGSLFTFDEMRERNWEHTQIEWDPPPLPQEPEADARPATAPATTPTLDTP